MSKEQELLARIKELETELQQTKKQKRYGLVWEDKPEDIIAKCKNELPILVEDNSKRIIEGGDDLTHILIEGDNYHALSVLTYTHEKKIDVIYIDPPYNTGNKDFIYNDTFIDREDSFRHSKWLSFISKRLEIAKKLLKDTGVIFISIDDNEKSQLKLLCDDIFGDRFIGTLVWKRRASSALADKMLSTDHEYILCYANQGFMFLGNGKTYENYTNPDNDPRGPWVLGDLTVGMGKDLRPNQYYDLIDPKTGKLYKPNPNRVWAYIPESMEKLLKEERVIFPLDTKKRPMRKRFQNELRSDMNPISSWMTEVGLNTEGSKDIQKIFGESNFQYAKPKSLIKYLINSSIKNGIILDFFAGSGTTGHAVLELNKEDKGNRQFILCTNNENKIAEEVTYSRISKVINGYSDTEGIPANLRYYRTDFIGLDKSIDDLRGKFMGRCTEMLQIRENTFLHFPLSKNGSKAGWELESEYFRVFQNTEKLLVVMYHPYEIETFKKWFEFLREKEDILQNANVPTHKEIVVYIFSMGGEIFEEELAHLSDRIRIETIPDEVLETYKKLFGF